MDTRSAAAWLRVAADDLRAIENNLFGPKPSLRAAAYHCQQAAELVKALLVASGRHPPKSHDVGALTDLLPEDHPLMPILLPLGRFSPYAWVFRYPSATLDDAEPDEPSEAEVTAWLSELQSAWQAAADHLAPAKPTPPPD